MLPSPLFSNSRCFSWLFRPTEFDFFCFVFFYIHADLLAACWGVFSQGSGVELDTSGITLLIAVCLRSQILRPGKGEFDFQCDDSGLCLTLLARHSLGADV